jgi:Uma2 family endonuclease
MSAEAIAPQWMHNLVTAEQYDSWSADQCAGIEIVDAMIVVSPSASKRHNRIAKVLAVALEAAAGNEWNADIDFDLRLHDVPLLNRRPDVVVYRAETIDISPTRPEHVLMVVEVVSPGSETTDRMIKFDQYAKAGIQFYWRVEQAMTGLPITYTYILDMASDTYRDAEVFSGVIDAMAPFPVKIDLTAI